MVKNHRLARAISDCGWGEFRRQLEYKCQRAGRQLVVIGRWYPSSKTCSACGHLLTELSLSTRTWQCPSCRARHDRDVNAAKNILAAGLAVARGFRGDACGADQTVHAVMHLAWVDRGHGRYQGQMAVYVKPRGRLGKQYMAFIAPFRHWVVYPALLRQIERAWQAR